MRGVKRYLRYINDNTRRVYTGIVGVFGLVVGIIYGSIVVIGAATVMIALAVFVDKWAWS